MATSFEEIYCLNTVIKIDKRLNNKPSYLLYELNWKYLEFAIAMFQFDCRKDLKDLIPFSLTKYSFTGDGVNNIFQLDPAPTSENLEFYINTQIDCGQPSVQVTDYLWDDINKTITFTNITPAPGEVVEIYAYVIGQFNCDLEYSEKAILASAMNIPYYQEQLTNSEILQFATYGGSIKMHSQAEQIKNLNETLRNAKREVEGDISNYSYRTAPVGYKGLGARTVCLHPLRYQPKNACVKRLNSILHPYSESNTEEQANSQITDLTKSSFNSSTDHRIVYKNFNYKTPYDAWIYEGNETNKIVGYKYLQSYPYDEPKFKIGDYVHWNYNHKEFSTWILISLDTEHLYNVKGRMLLCNNSLRWKDKVTGETNCYPCVIEDSMTYTNFKWGNRGVIEPSGDIVVVVQRNEYTSQISINDRFLFDGVGFKVKQFFNELNPNYLELYMMKTPELDGDDFTGNIAINEKPEEKDVLQNTVISPNIDRVNQGETIQFSVYNYINEVKQLDEFSIEIKEVPKDYYELDIIDGNNFKIKNIKEYQRNPMIINCQDIATGDEFQKSIWLGGNW